MQLEKGEHIIGRGSVVERRKIACRSIGVDGPTLARSCK
jgi:hypothetical protein